MATLIKIGRTWFSDFRHRGHRIRRRLSPYKEQARILLPALIRQVRGDSPRDSTDMSWPLFKARYLDFARANKTPNTVYKDQAAFDMVDRECQLRRLAEMTPELLERLKGAWISQGRRPSIVTRSVKALKTAMRKAEDWKYVPLQNWRTVKVEEPGGRLVHYTLDQFRALLKVCPPAWQMAAMLMGRAGIRSGEAWHLEWPDVDFERRRLHVHSRPDWRIKGDRKGNAEKWIPMDPDLKAYLWKRRKKEGFLIQVSGYGPRMDSRWFLTKLRKFMRRAGLPGSPHALRHTCASMMVSNGATLEEVAAVLGHRNLRATMIYSHLSSEAKERAINRLPRL